MENTAMNIMLAKFKDHCQRWHAAQRIHNYRGRTNVIAYLTTRYGIEAVRRHKKMIIATLNHAEGVYVLE